MRFDPISRRHFLQGLGGATLILPFLPSLMSASLAAAAEPDVSTCFAAIGSGHGGLYDSSWFGSMVPSVPFEVRPGHTGHYSLIPDNLSDVFDASFNPFKSKITLLRGLDIPQYIEHSYYTQLGNFATYLAPNTVPVATIDQVMAYSNKVYPTLQGIKRSIHPLPMLGGTISARYSNPAANAGPIEQVPGVADPRALFDSIFGTTVGTGRSPDTGLIDAVYSDYLRLKRDVRLGNTDRQVLDNHITNIQELQQRMGGAQVCTNLAPPTTENFWLDPTEPHLRRIVQLNNDIVVAAFRCRLTRLATIGANWIEDFHAEAHAWVDPQKQARILSIHQWLARYAFLDLIAKMDGITEANGRTLLDNSVVFWASENSLPHMNWNQRVVMAGSAGGRLRTGNFIDYQSRESQYPLASDGRNAWKPGVLYHRFLVTMLQAMGLSPADYERPREGHYTFGGYGAITANNGNGWDAQGFPHAGQQDLLDNHYRPQDVGLPLPFLKI